MVICAVTFLLALALSAVLTPLIRQVAVARGWVDVARSSRKIHSRPIPRLGGVAMVMAFYVPLIVTLVVRSDLGQRVLAHPEQVVGILVGGLLIAIVGIFDDLRGMGAAKKFSAQFLVAGVMFSLGIAIEKVTTPWGSVALGYFSLPFTMMWIVGVINAINLIDGLDGLASGVALTAIGANFLIALQGNYLLVLLVMAALGGAVLGFLLYNFNPASIFMGDTGSMFLGLVIAGSSVVANSKSTATVAMLVPVLALGLPIMDTLLAVGRRAARGQPLFAADKEHIHHKLLDMGLSQRKAVLVLYGIGVAFGALALALTYANARQTALLLAAAALVVGLFVRKLGYGPRVFKEFEERRERNLALREQVREIGEKLRQAALPVHAWEAVQPIAPAMGLTQFALTLRSMSQTGAQEMTRFEWKQEHPGNDCSEASFALESAGGPLGEVRVAWQGEQRVIERDDEIALELLCDHLTNAARRMSSASSKIVSISRRR